LIQNPDNLGCREIGIEDQAGAAGDETGQALGPQALAMSGGTPVLPDDGPVKGLPGVPVPDHGSFALIGDAHGRQGAGRKAGTLEHTFQTGQLGAPDLLRIMLDPAGLWIMLGELLLRHTVHLTQTIEEDGA
jgi:hypothetical protein